MLGALAAAASLAAQTVITPPKNKYTPAQDVELGRKAAQQVEQQLPLLRDDAVGSPVSALGARLAAAIPAELRHAEFHYTFQVVNVKEINAFALPGGPMFLNRGMLEAAKTEGEVAGVIAHEISHVALRHGTAQATKATKYEIGQMLGTILGSVIGGTVGGAVAQGTQFGLGTAFLRFSRADEKQADLLGSHIMADAGYDPREMANMFTTIEKEGSSGPTWLSDHPNPGNRADYITKEAATLSVRNPVRDTRAFADVQARLHQLPPAPSTEEATRTANANKGSSAPAAAPTADYGSIAAPSTRYTTYNEGNVFKVSVPSNWREYAARNSVTFAPDGGYGTVKGQSDFTHGMQLGLARSDARDLQGSTDALIQGMAQGNPNLGRTSPSYQRMNIGGRQGLYTVLANLSASTGQQERIAVYTTQLDDGTLFYAFGAAPGDRFSTYADTFRRIVGSIQFLR